MREIAPDGRSYAPGASINPDFQFSVFRSTSPHRLAAAGRPRPQRTPL